MKGIISALLICFLVGCAPSYSVWVDGMNSWVGTRFESHIYESCAQGCGDSYWSPSNHNETFDKIINEQGGKRYYVTWLTTCKYSVLVGGDGVIKSWRYESSNTNNCFVF